VEAALLSRNGFTSAAQPLEGRRGLFALMSAFSGAEEQQKEQARSTPLGEAWLAMG
jgi:2-methylcitrate dehydratase PrpD